LEAIEGYRATSYPDPTTSKVLWRSVRCDMIIGEIATDHERQVGQVIDFDVGVEFCKVENVSRRFLIETTSSIISRAMTLSAARAQCVNFVVWCLGGILLKKRF
jgi:hypothetical protein